MDTQPQQDKQATPKQVKKVPCEVYSRIVGYLRPTQNWHDGKRQEFEERKEYTLTSE